MTCDRLDLRTLLGGVVTVLLGVATLLKARSYPMGSVLRMGPGFFPTLIAGLITLLGVLLVIRAMGARPSEPPDFQWRPVLMIPGGIALFALLLERVGLAAATVALVFVSSLAEPVFRPLRSVVLSIAILAMIYVVFILILHMPIAVLP